MCITADHMAAQVIAPHSMHLSTFKDDIWSAQVHTGPRGPGRIMSYDPVFGCRLSVPRRAPKFSPHLTWGFVHVSSIGLGSKRNHGFRSESGDGTPVAITQQGPVVMCLPKCTHQRRARGVGRTLATHPCMQCPSLDATVVTDHEMAMTRSVHERLGRSIGLISTRRKRDGMCVID